MLQREALAVGVRCFEGGGVGLADDLVEPPTDRAPFDRCDGQAPSGGGGGGGGADPAGGDSGGC
jgi:hypothetical protein